MKSFEVNQEVYAAVYEEDEQRWYVKRGLYLQSVGEYLQLKISSQPSYTLNVKPWFCFTTNLDAWVFLREMFKSNISHFQSELQAVEARIAKL
jgi:hypothetical protein